MNRNFKRSFLDVVMHLSQAGKKEWRPMELWSCAFPREVAGIELELPQVRREICLPLAERRVCVLLLHNRESKARVTRTSANCGHVDLDLAGMILQSSEVFLDSVVILNTSELRELRIWTIC